MPTLDDNSEGTEDAIRNSIQRGELDNLKGKGKPLDLNDYFNTPEDIRLGYTLLKNAGYIPEEVQLLNQISEIKGKISQEKIESKLKELRKQLRDIQLKYDLQMERMHKR
jgi:DNA-binding response OmpR family regulator